MIPVRVFTKLSVGIFGFWFFAFLPLAASAQEFIVPYPSGTGACSQVLEEGPWKCFKGKCTSASPAAGTVEPAAPTGVECDYTFCDLVRIFINISRIIFGTAGGLALLYFLWGTVSLIISGGSPEKVQAGKKSISAALWGLLIVLISYQLIGVIFLTAAEIAGPEGAIKKTSEGGLTIFAKPWSQLEQCAPSELQIPLKESQPPAGGAAAPGGGTGPAAPATPAPAPSKTAPSGK